MKKIILISLFSLAITVDSEWTDENELIHLLMNLGCNVEYDNEETFGGVYSCIKIDWVKCYLDYYKKEFSAKEFEILYLQELGIVGETPIKLFEKRSAKVLNIAEQQCGESHTKNLLDEYENFYHISTLLFDSKDILSRLELPGVATQNPVQAVYDNFFQRYNRYKVLIQNFKNSEQFEAQFHNELLVVHKQVTELYHRISNEKPNND